MYNSRHGADRVSMSKTIVSHYDLLEELGHGGGGRVYRALDLNLGRPVALKFLLPSLVDSPEARARFLREGQALSALSHPHIATVFEGGAFKMDIVNRDEAFAMSVKLPRGPSWRLNICREEVCATESGRRAPEASP